MCTVAWQHRPVGYTLVFNRDEQHARALAEPPQRRIAASGRACLAPRDPQGGGTWLAVNSAGVTWALLNYYAAEVPAQAVPASGVRTRGEIVAQLAGATEPSAVSAILSPERLVAYRPFCLLRVSSDAAQYWRWDGQRWSGPAPATAPLSTSSFQTERVVARRRQLWRGLTMATPGDLERYARHYDACDPAGSVTMERPDARTVSLSRIDVTRHRVGYYYQPKGRGPLGWGGGQWLELEREP